MRAIHVADYYDDRIYFLVDKEDDHDGAIIKQGQEPFFIDFFSFMIKVSGDKGWKEITNTKFHDFLWHGQNGALTNRWHRVFREHSIEPRKELLLSVPVVTNFPEHQKRKKASEKRSNRASEFKSLLAAGLHEKALGRGIGRAGRRLARGGKFDPTPIDADLDMLVQEGTPWERPALPGVPDSPRRMARRARQQGLQSRRGDSGSGVEGGWKTRDGKGWREFHKDPDRYVDISPKEARQVLEDEHRAVEKAYSGGEPIRTRGELQAALAKAHPGFEPGEGSDFDAMGWASLGVGPLVTLEQNRNTELAPIEREVGYALLEHLRLNPNLQDANLQVHSFRSRDEHDLVQVSMNADGWAMYTPGTLFDFDQNGELIIKEDEKPTLEIAYKGDTPLAENDHRRNHPDRKSPLASHMKTGKRYWDASLDSPFSPRADPKQSASGGMDMMARRVYMSFMAELDEPHMVDSDQGWELDPTDNWYTPHSIEGVHDPRLGRHVGRPVATRRSRKVRKQHEEATRHASANVAHHEFSHADHYMAMRKDLIAAVKKHVGEGGTTMEGLEKFVREQLVSNMTDRQKRRALEAVVSERLANIFPKYVAHVNAIKRVSLTGIAKPEFFLTDPSPDPADLQGMRDRSRESLEGLVEHFKQPIMGADGEPILITDDIADFLNSHPVFTSSSLEGLSDLDPEDLYPMIDRDARPGEPVSAGEPLTRQHLLNVFGSEHAYMDNHGVPWAGDDTDGMPQRTPLWALILFHEAPGKRGQFGGSFVQPLSGRSLVTVRQHQLQTASPAGISTLNDFRYMPDAFEIMLEHGTPEINMFGVVGDDAEMERAAIIPALSPEGVRVLVDAMARTTGQIPRSWFETTSTIDMRDAGKALADIPPDTTPKLGKGRNVLPYLDEDLPAEEVGEALQELLEHWMKKVINTARSATPGSSQREIRLNNVAQWLEIVGRSAFHFDDLNEAEIDGIMDLLDDIGIESTLSGGRTVSWAPYMGWVDQRPPIAPGMMPLINGMSGRHHEFFAELGAALSSGLTIRPPVDSVQHTALKKVSAWLRRHQPFTAKVNIDTSGRAFTDISRIHLPRDDYLRREELLRQSLEMERLARNTTKQEPHG